MNMLQRRGLKVVCPNCGKNVGITKVSEYFIHGTRHTIKCPNCDCELRPAKEPLPIIVCFNSGALVAILAFWGYIKYVADNFMEAVAFSLLVISLFLLVICALVIYRIEFVEA